MGFGMGIHKKKKACGKRKVGNIISAKGPRYPEGREGEDCMLFIAG
jgi:hypothetical protein